MPAKALTLGRPVYRGYIPIDLPQNRKRAPFKHWWKVLGKPRVTLFPRQEPEEWAPEAEYPPLQSEKGSKHQFRLNWYEELKNIPTVDAKLWEINRQCRHYVANFNNWIPLPDSLAAAKWMTHTHFIDKLPESYQSSPGPIEQLSDGVNKINDSDVETNLNSRDAELISRITPIVLNQIAIEKYESLKKTNTYISKSIANGYKSHYVQDSLIQGLVNGLRRALSPDVNQQLLDYQIDLSPAIRSWWYHSGFGAPNNKVFYKSRKDDEGRINQIIQVNGSSAVNFRSEFLIEPQIDLNHELVTNTSLIQEQTKSLKFYSPKFAFKWPVALPGYWYDEVQKLDCPHTCFLTTDSLEIRNSKYYNYARPLDDTEDALNCQAILTAFSWLNSLSIYHGYTPFQELDYPFTCQVITTDGQNWLFNVFQMNSHTFHRDLGGPQRNNICWSSGLMKLYDEYTNDGKFEGVNKQVLELLVKFFSKQTSPTYTDSLNLRPHLGEDTRTEEERGKTMKQLRCSIEQRYNRWLAKEWQVPQFEHIFFKSPQSRGQIRHMKARWHIPKPKFPKVFE